MQELETTSEKFDFVRRFYKQQLEDMKCSHISIDTDKGLAEERNCCRDAGTPETLPVPADIPETSPVPEDIPETSTVSGQALRTTTVSGQALRTTTPRPTTEIPETWTECTNVRRWADQGGAEISFS